MTSLPTTRVLVTADELRDLVADPDRHVVVLDVRWSLGGPPGHPTYLTGHVPGAVFVSLDTELAAPGQPVDGRHPLPCVEALQAAARRWGIRQDSVVVAYDDLGAMAAARAWWLLRWGGLSDVRLLDGALSAWTSMRGELATDDVVPEPGDVVLTGACLPVLDVEDVLDLAEQGVLLDARTGERYRGETEPVDPKAGHVPGALSAPTGDNLDAEGRFLSTEELRARFESLGVAEETPVAVYCGSGVTAAHQVAALAIAGYDAALYPGSWSQWSNLDRPVATGE